MSPLSSLPVNKPSTCLLLDKLTHHNVACHLLIVANMDLIWCFPLWWYTSTYLGACRQVWREYNKAHKNWIKHQRLIRKALKHYICESMGQTSSERVGVDARSYQDLQLFTNIFVDFSNLTRIFWTTKPSPIHFLRERTSKYDGALHSDCDVIATSDQHGEEAAKKLPSILLRAKIAAQAHPAHVAGAEGFYNKGIARHSGLASRSLGRATMGI